MFRLRAGYFPEKESSQSSPGLRARTQGSCAVSPAIPSGAVPSGRVSNRYRCRSAQLTKQVLLQDEKRLRGSTYTVGGERRVGPLFACRGRCLIGPRAAAGHPYGNESFSGVRPPWGNSTKGAEAPFWSFQGERVLRERGKFEIPLSLSGSLVTFCPHRKSLARRRNIP